MESRDNFRERVEALARRTLMVEQQLRWWRGMAEGLLVLGLLSWALLGSAQATSYIFTTIDVPFPGTQQTFAHAINERGVIVGTYSATACQCGFVYLKGEIFTIPTTLAQGINRQRHIVGVFATPEGHSVLYAGGTFSFLDVPEAGFTQATGINDAGVIVGYYQDLSTVNHGFLYHDGTFETLDVPFERTATGQRYRAINNAGTIVGVYDSPDGHQHGFVLSNGQYRSFDVPGSLSTVALGVSQRGIIVGSYQDEQNVTHGFVYNPRSGHFDTVDVPGSTLTVVSGINSTTLVGWYQDNNHISHGFMATQHRER